MTAESLHPGVKLTLHQHRIQTWVPIFHHHEFYSFSLLLPLQACKVCLGLWSARLEHLHMESLGELMALRSQKTGSPSYRAPHALAESAGIAGEDTAY